MSWAALAWAGKCKPGSASRKLVLFALADRHNDEVNGCYPSIAWLVEFTSLNRKTVINCLSELEAAGFIADTGERRGETRQIKFYRLNLETVPKAEQSQKRNSSENAPKQSQKRDTDTVREPVSSEPKGSSPRAWALPAGVSLQVWQDFKRNRHRKRLPNTDTAWKAFNDDLHRVSRQTGIPPPKLIEMCTAKGWGGIYDPTESKRNERDSNPTGTALARVQDAFRGRSPVH